MAAADLAVTLTGPTAVAVDVESAYRAVVSNNGPFAAPAVTLSISLPVGATISSLTHGDVCSVLGQAITCLIGPLGAGEQMTVALRISFGGAGNHVLTAAASINSGASDPSPADAVAALDVTVTDPRSGPQPPGTLPDTAGMPAGLPLLIGMLTLAGFAQGAVWAIGNARAKGRPDRFG